MTGSEWDSNASPGALLKETIFIAIECYLTRIVIPI